MAYSNALAERIRARLATLPVVEEKEMMGGLTFMVNDKMCVGVIKDELMCRIDPALHAEAVERIGCRTMDFTKRPMKGYVLVDQSGMGSEGDLSYWLGLALDFNARAKSSKKTAR
jgi:TfoX/Sxy family transcriptional regulator of competence genes